ncbi:MULTISPECIES: response regulator transcription factor [Shewanella]|uniref:DNA-binding response regulator n=1 Tax=Shewanella japonica TaxID=93973 RepID=A0ABM6JR70_9GAMM|nr:MULTISPECIES: response regulator transcription factor [Shewanella]ARD24131.1 DNA-binding response regulator [Shewanella japonica]KPZ69145.1 Transcriptional activator protein CzcR [Shewanella sp. P1-14-1]MBQ4891384.1 response regulator transcription factor [Shewanella sp. MMG014]OBT04739.1 DNA-binding response regulator [Shewanella sp. UCD-FRSSP16_17]
MKLLLVEDSEALRRPVIKALKASGFAVDATGDGQEGLWMALEHDYDVIILDIMLPSLDGRDVLKQLREANNESPVLFLTAKDAIEDRVAGLRLGADDYLVKSFAIEELIARVEALARRKYQNRSPKLVVADLELDRSAKTVMRAQQSISLPSQLFALLEYLMLNTNKVISRTQIEQHIYDEQVSPSSNVVDTAVCALRKAISVSSNSAPLIHTRRGMGYMISAEKP